MHFRIAEYFMRINIKFYIFSNDLDYCKEYFSNYDNIYYINFWLYVVSEQNEQYKYTKVFEKKTHYLLKFSKIFTDLHEKYIKIPKNC